MSIRTGHVAANGPNGGQPHDTSAQKRRRVASFIALAVTAALGVAALGVRLLYDKDFASSNGSAAFPSASRPFDILLFDQNLTGVSLEGDPTILAGPVVRDSSNWDVTLRAAFTLPPQQGNRAVVLRIPVDANPYTVYVCDQRLDPDDLPYIPDQDEGRLLIVQMPAAFPGVCVVSAGMLVPERQFARHKKVGIWEFAISSGYALHRDPNSGTYHSIRPGFSARLLSLGAVADEEVVSWRVVVNVLHPEYVLQGLQPPAERASPGRGEWKGATVEATGQYASVQKRETVENRRKVLDGLLTGMFLLFLGEVVAVSRGRLLRQP